MILPAIYSLGWYASSISMTLFNKYLFSQYGFRFPVFATMFHSTGIFLVTWAILSNCMTKPNISRKVFFKFVVPVGVFAGLDIALSNMSYLYITVTLYTMVKSSVLVWVLLFSFLFRLEKPSVVLVVIILLVAGGIFLATFGTTEVHLGGVMLVVVASILSGLRWTTTQLLMRKEGLMLDALATMYYVTPVQAACLVPLFFGLEFSSLWDEFAEDAEQTGLNILLTSLGLLMAFGLTACEFLLIHATSTLTLSVVGTLKELATIGCAVLFFGDELSTLNVVGFSICFFGICLYKYLRYVQYKAKTQNAGYLAKDRFRARDGEIEPLALDDNDTYNNLMTVDDDVVDMINVALLENGGDISIAESTGDPTLIPLHPVIPAVSTPSPHAAPVDPVSPAVSTTTATANPVEEEREVPAEVGEVDTNAVASARLPPPPTPAIAPPPGDATQTPPAAAAAGATPLDQPIGFAPAVVVPMARPAISEPVAATDNAAIISPTD